MFPKSIPYNKQFVSVYVQDKMMVSFFNTGDWFKESGVKPLEKFVPPRRYYCVLNMIFWTLVTLIPFFYVAFNVLLSGNLLHITLLSAPFGLRKFYSCFVLFLNWTRNCIRATEAPKLGYDYDIWYKSLRKFVHISAVYIYYI